MKIIERSRESDITFPASQKCILHARPDFNTSNPVRRTKQTKNPQKLHSIHPPTRNSTFTFSSFYSSCCCCVRWWSIKWSKQPKAPHRRRRASYTRQTTRMPSMDRWGVCLLVDWFLISPNSSYSGVERSGVHTRRGRISKPPRHFRIAKSALTPAAEEINTRKKKPVATSVVVVMVVCSGAKRNDRTGQDSNNPLFSTTTRGRRGGEALSCIFVFVISFCILVLQSREVRMSGQGWLCSGKCGT